MCRVDGCEKKNYAQGFCSMHYKRAKKLGEIGLVNKQRTGICEVEGCSNNVYSSGKCNKHYRQEQRKNVKRKCSVEGCEKPHLANGFCNRHNQQFEKYGKILEEKQPKVCCIEGCNNKYFAKEFCRKHYKRWRKTGDPLKGLRPNNLRECAKCGQLKKIHGNDLCHRCYEKSKSFERSNYRHSRRLKIKNGAEKFTKQQVLNKTNGYCGICGAFIDLTLKHPHKDSFSVDHIIPISKGGVHTLENVQAAHLLCNCKKQAN